VIFPKQDFPFKELFVKRVEQIALVKILFGFIFFAKAKLTTFSIAESAQLQEC
jgi:hypothetical protein